MSMELVRMGKSEFAEIARESKLFTCTVQEGDGISKTICIQNFEVVAEWHRSDVATKCGLFKVVRS